MVCDSCYHLPETILSEVSSHAPGTFGAGSARYARSHLVRHGLKDKKSWSEPDLSALWCEKVWFKVVGGQL
mgnify:CR=1 FL=1